MRRSPVLVLAPLLAGVLASAGPALASGPIFQRGDCNSDAAVDIADAIFTLGGLFVPGQPQPICDDACDANDDGLKNIADAVYTLTWLFFPGSPPPPAPFPDCGIDPTDIDTLFCFDSTAGCDSGLYFETIESGTQSGLPPTQAIVRTETDWIDLWNAHWSIQTPAPPVPSIDFTQWMVVAVVEPLGPPSVTLEVFEIFALPPLVEVNIFRTTCTLPNPVMESPWTFVMVETAPGDLVVWFFDDVCP